MHKKFSFSYTTAFIKNNSLLIFGGSTIFEKVTFQQGAASWRSIRSFAQRLSLPYQWLSFSFYWIRSKEKKIPHSPRSSYYLVHQNIISYVARRWSGIRSHQPYPTVDNSVKANRKKRGCNEPLPQNDQAVDFLAIDMLLHIHWCHQL